MEKKILRASIGHYNAMISKHEINVRVLLENPVGVAEHPDLLETVETELAQMAHYRDLLHEAEALLLSYNTPKV